MRIASSVSFLAAVLAVSATAAASHAQQVDTLKPGTSITIVSPAAVVAPPPVVTPPPVTPPPVTPPPVTSAGWNLPAGWKVQCQTGPITSLVITSSSVAMGGPKPCTWSFPSNRGDGSIALSSAATVDPQPSGYRITIAAGKNNDPAVDMYVTHADSGTGSYYIGWKQRWQPLGSYAALQKALNGANPGGIDSKAWSPKTRTGGDLTIMSFLSWTQPIIGLNFQGVDGHNIPNNNSSTPIAGTIPAAASQVLPGVAAGKGGWDQEEIIITGTGSQATSSVCFYVNSAKVGCATGVTNAAAWFDTHQYLSRSVYSGGAPQSVYTDIDQVTIAVK